MQKVADNSMSVDYVAANLLRGSAPQAGGASHQPAQETKRWHRRVWCAIWRTSISSGVVPAAVRLLMATTYTKPTHCSAKVTQCSPGGHISQHPVSRKQEALHHAGKSYSLMALRELPCPTASSSQQLTLGHRLLSIIVLGPQQPGFEL